MSVDNNSAVKSVLYAIVISMLITEAAAHFPNLNPITSVSSVWDSLRQLYDYV